MDLVVWGFFACLSLITSFYISSAGSTARHFSLVSKGLLIRILLLFVSHVNFLILWPFSGLVGI